MIVQFAGLQKTNKIAESTGLSQLELEPTDGIACRHAVVGRGQSECKEQTAYHLVPMPAVAKKFTVDLPVREVSTESVPDWAKRTGAIKKEHKKSY